MRNIIDKINDDNTNIIISTKSIKWLLGILTTCVISIFGFAWNLYIKVDFKVDKVKDEIIHKMEELDKEKVKPTIDKNHTQDMDIVRLYERTNSREERLNNEIRPNIIQESTNMPPKFNK
jgi:hypothetical protein